MKSLCNLKRKMKLLLDQASQIELVIEFTGEDFYSEKASEKLSSIYSDFGDLHRMYRRETGKIWDKSL